MVQEKERIKDASESSHHPGASDPSGSFVLPFKVVLRHQNGMIHKLSRYGDCSNT